MRHRQGLRPDRRTQLRHETLEPRVMLALTSDAPDPYPSASVSNNAGPILGDERSIDDGAVFSDFYVGQVDASVLVEVSNAGGARLDGWIDFNRDGSFSGQFEQVFDFVPVSAGDNLLTFDVPAWADIGPTYARLRVSTGSANGLPQGGGWNNGEVEDYPIEILQPFAGSANFGEERPVSWGVMDGVVDVLTVDIDQDGDVDVVASSQNDGQINAFLNDGAGNFPTFVTIGSVAALPDNAVFTVGLTSGDLDGDGDIDIASASMSDDTVAWYRNTLNDNGTLSFIKNSITTNADGARAVVAADFDEDGRLDLAAVSEVDDLLRVFRNTGTSPGQAIFVESIAETFPPNSSVADLFAADIDQDNRIDLVIVTAISNEVVWYENDGSPFNGEWPVGRVIYPGDDDGTPQRGSGVFASDLDEDDDLDVVASSFAENRVDWFRSNSSGGGWSPRIQVNSAVNPIQGANPTFVADIDGDEDMDILAPAYNGNRVDFYENNGNGSFRLSDSVSFGTPTNVAAADLDGDGVLDIIATGFQNDRISWWRNPRLPSGIDIDGNGVEINDDDDTPRALDGTEFESVGLGGAAPVQTFEIRSNGSGTLTIGEVSVPAGFILVTAPAQVVPSGESTEFSVRLDTSSAGIKTGQISIPNNDSNENPYNFTIRGEVTNDPAPTPEVTVRRNGVNITDDDPSPSQQDGTDFGVAAFGGSTVTRTFTVTNDGDAELVLTNLTVPAGYTVTDFLSPSLGIGQSDSFTIQLDTAVAGVKSGEITFNTNDADENPFNFAITGTVDEDPPPAAEVRVTFEGNNSNVEDDDPTPDADNGTDFGAATQGGSVERRSFRVHNDGDAELTISNPSVPAGFRFTDVLPTTLAPGRSNRFTIVLDTDEIGVMSGEVSFNTNDADENPFNFAITGTVNPPTGSPEVTVHRNFVNIDDNDPSPSAADGTDFGGVTQGDASSFRTFTVRNDGAEDLLLSNLSVPPGYTITNTLNPTLGPGQSDSFTVGLDTDTVGTKSGEISFTTNDTDENPFNFAITGVVLAALQTGDANNDGVVNTLDINPFVLALTDQAGYMAAFPGVDVLAVADTNSDGVINTLDINPFVALLTGGASQPGDANNDGVVNTLDINPFVLALTDQAGYLAAYPGVDYLAVADINRDNFVNTLDINPFVNVLTGGASASTGSSERSDSYFAALAEESRIDEQPSRDAFQSGFRNRFSTLSGASGDDEALSRAFDDFGLTG